MSTDLARVAVVARTGSFNQFEVTFSEPFEVELDPRLGDTPPDVTVTSPNGGEAYLTGEVATVSWQASDDREIRNLAVQASYDAGESWHFVAEQIEPSLSSYSWSLAPGLGFAEVLVRVIATDDRFQSRSDASDASFAIVDGQSPVRFDRGDCNSDSGFNLIDPLTLLGYLFQGSLMPCAVACDANDDDTLGLNDALVLLNRLFAGGAPLPPPSDCGTDPTAGSLECATWPSCP